MPLNAFRIFLLRLHSVEMAENYIDNNILKIVPEQKYYEASLRLKRRGRLTDIVLDNFESDIHV